MTNKSVLGFFQFVKSTLMLFLLLAVLCPALALEIPKSSQDPLNERIDIRLESVAFDQIVKVLERKSKIKVLYVSSLIDEDQKFSLNHKNETVENILNDVLKDLNIRYEVDNEFVILKKADQGDTKRVEKKSENNSIDISGVIVDEDEEPLIGVTIQVKGTGRGAVTGIEGDFVLSGLNDSDVLIISMVGFTTQEIRVGSLGSSEVRIQLALDVESLEEVVVVGYGSVRKTDLAGAISTIQVTDLPTAAVATFDAALQGMSTGVSVQSSSGKPGAPTSITIRGPNSILTSTEPLFVIDGVQIFVGPSGGQDALQVNPISTINPSDIKSLTVLKDAAATAIYGSRASNGVIIITTKSGNQEESFVSVNMSAGVSDLTRTPADVGYVNKQEYFAIMDQAYNRSFGRDFRLTDHYGTTGVPPYVDRLTRSEVNVLDLGTDWFDQIFEQGSFQQVNASLGNTFDRGSLYLSAGYRRDEGVLNFNDLERSTLRTNVQYDITDNLTVDSRIFLSFLDNEDRNGLTTVTQNSLPWMPVFDPFASDVRYFNPELPADYNVVAFNDPSHTLDNTRVFRSLLNFAINYDLPWVEGLSLRSEFSTDFYQSNNTTFRSGLINVDSERQPAPSAIESAITNTSTLVNVYSTYGKELGKHRFSVTGGTEIQRAQRYIREVSAVGIPSTLQQLGQVGDVEQATGQIDFERYIFSLFGRLNYTYNDRYILGFSGRRDGSSAFTKENRNDEFYAVSAGWIISNEDFFGTLSKSTFLKLRGSFGTVGNQNLIGQFDQQVYFQTSQYGGATGGTNPINIPNDQLRWEKTLSTDIALEFSVLKNRISGTVGYFDRTVDNLFVPVQLPASTGLSTIPNADVPFLFLAQTPPSAANRIVANVGRMSNFGFEFEINTTNIQKADFKWSTSFNLTLLDNEVRSLAEGFNDGIGLINGSPTVNQVGQRRFTWYMADFAGVDPDTGVPMIYARDSVVFAETGKTVRLRTESGADSLIFADDVNIPNNQFLLEGKSSDPTYYGGILNKFQYKGFDLSFLFSFSGGNYIMDKDRQRSLVPNTRRTLLRQVENESWENPGDVVPYPKLVANGAQTIDGVVLSEPFSNQFVYHNRELFKADFIRLRNVTIGYSFSEEMLEKIGFGSLRLYASANNLWTITDYPGFDPEGVLVEGAALLDFNTPIPQLRTYSFGLDIQF